MFATGADPDPSVMQEGQDVSFYGDLVVNQLMSAQSPLKAINQSYNNYFVSECMQENDNLENSNQVPLCNGPWSALRSDRFIGEGKLWGLMCLHFGHLQS